MRRSFPFEVPQWAGVRLVQVDYNNDKSVLSAPRATGVPPLLSHHCVVFAGAGTRTPSSLGQGGGVAFRA